MSCYTPASAPFHECSLSTSHPLSHSISYNCFSPQYHAFLAARTSNDDPKYFSQAIQHPHWRDAMQAEITALETNNTWEFVPLPSNKKALGCKWVYKTKYHVEGTIE